MTTIYKLRDGLPAVPRHMAALPIDKRGYPIPWFVEYINGEPDFRVASSRKRHFAMADRICWVCGGVLGKHQAFVVGPMCTVNRTSSDPPSHYDCARFSAEACPFLANPSRVRRESGLPTNMTHDGIMIRRNPGVTALWVSAHKLFRDPRGGILFELLEPQRVEWFAQGRAATRAEVEESMTSGCPALQKIAEQEGEFAVVAFLQMKNAAMRYLPA